MEKHFGPRIFKFELLPKKGEESDFFAFMTPEFDKTLREFDLVLVNSEKFP